MPKILDKLRVFNCFALLQFKSASAAEIAIRPCQPHLAHKKTLLQTKMFDTAFMNLAPLGSFRHYDVGSIFGKAIQRATATSNKTNASSGATAASQPSDSSQLSPLAQILGTLQAVQQSNPSQYQQLAQLIAANLNQTAQQTGSSQLPNQLTQLAADFTNTSNTGSLPNVNDLASVIGGNGASQQSQENSLSVQISFSETSINDTVNNNPAGGTTNPAASNGNSQAVQQQFQESSLSYQFNFTETSINSAAQNAYSTTAGNASGQSFQLDPQQLLELIAKSLQNAAATAQSTGDSTDANLLTQLATEFNSALNAQGSANTQAAAGDPQGGSSASTSQAGSGNGTQSAIQQLQESSLSYQLNFSEPSTTGNNAYQEAFSLSASYSSLSAVF